MLVVTYSEASTKMGLGLHNVEIIGKDNKPIISQLEIDVGATSPGRTSRRVTTTNS